MAAIERFHWSEVAIVIVSQLISVFMITVDRVLKVNFSIKYNLFVTKRKLLLVCMCCWLISTGHGCIIWFVPHLFNKVFLVWEVFLVFFIVASYVDIFIYLCVKDRIG